MDPQIPVSKIKGVGVIVAQKLKRLGITTVADLVWYLPSGYEDFRVRASVKNAPLDQPLTLTGVISSSSSRRSWQRRKLVVTEAVFSDETESLRLTWFGRFALRIPTNIPIHLTGTIVYERGRRQMVNSAIDRVSATPRPCVAWALASCSSMDFSRCASIPA